LKSVSGIPYIGCDAKTTSRRPCEDRTGGKQAVYEDFAMTFEILHLTTQIQRWLNRRIAQHLAEQAERLAR
jgi:hypothetical protein